MLRVRDGYINIYRLTFSISGGFYQDEVAQTVPIQGQFDIPCKLCNEGMFVREGHGTSIHDCEVCPEGTNKSINAGYRACYCKIRHARVDRST